MKFFKGMNEVPTLSNIVESLKDYENYKSNLNTGDGIKDQIDEQVLQ